MEETVGQRGSRSQREGTVVGVGGGAGGGGDVYNRAA